MHHLNSLLKVAVGKLPKIHVYGSDWDTPDGSGVRDYIHIVDLATGHVAALRKLETANIGCQVVEFLSRIGLRSLAVFSSSRTIWAQGEAIRYWK